MEPRLLEPPSFDRSEVALIEGSILELTGGFLSKFDNIAAGIQMYAIIQKIRY